MADVWREAEGVNMTIAKTMLGAVRHYLGSEIIGAQLVHNDVKRNRLSFDDVYRKDGRTFGDSLDEEKQEFLRHCKGMLRDPVPEEYAHRKLYHLRPADRRYITELLRKAEEADWRKAEEIDGLCSDIDEYAPHGGEMKAGFEKGKSA